MGNMIQNCNAIMEDGDVLNSRIKLCVKAGFWNCGQHSVSWKYHQNQYEQADIAIENQIVEVNTCSSSSRPWSIRTHSVFTLQNKYASFVCLLFSPTAVISFTHKNRMVSNAIEFAMKENVRQQHGNLLVFVRVLGKFHPLPNAVVTLVVVAVNECEKSS